jgi:hypothetical protein
MNTSTEATVPTPPEFTKGAGLGKTGGMIPADSNVVPPERSFSSLGTTKMPAYGAKNYHEYGAPAPSLPTSTTERRE